MKPLPILPLAGWLLTGILHVPPLRAAPPAIPDAPVLEAGYLGGTGRNYTVDGAVALVRLPDGSRILGAQTTSDVFPGALRLGPVGGRGAVVARYPATGTRPDWVTVVGGVQLWNLAAGPDGSVYLTGHAEGGLPYGSTAQGNPGGGVDGFVAKLRADGSGLAYFTYLGGVSFDVGLGIAVDPEGRAVVSGVTASPDFPIRAGAFQATPGGRFDGFLTRVSADGSRFESSTRFGGAGSDRIAAVRLDSSGRMLVAGKTSSTNLPPPATGTELRIGPVPERTDAFVARFSTDGTALERLVRIGGNGAEGAARIALQPDGGVVVLGATESADWPVTTPGATGAQGDGGDLFLARFTADLDSVTASVVFGSPSTESVERVDYFGGFDVDGEAAGNQLLEVECAGLSVSDGGDVLVSATSRTAFWGSVRAGGGNAEMVAARFSPDLGVLRWLDVLGGREDDAGGGIVDDGAGGAWVAGEAGRPLTPPYFPTAGVPGQAAYGGGITDAVLVRLGAPTAVPANDTFAAAAPLGGARVTVRADLSGATVEPGEEVPGAGAFVRSAWWTWTPEASGWLEVSMPESAAPAAWAVFGGTGPGSLVRLGTASAGIAAPRIAVVAGAPYRIQVVGPAGGPGPVGFSLRLASVRNDDFADRTTVQGIPLDLPGDTTGATAESGEERAGDGTLGGGSIWYGWTATETRAVELLLGGSLFLPSLDVVVGDSLAEAVRIQSASGAAGGDGDSGRSVTFLATAGRRYAFRVDGYMGVTGPFTLAVRPGNPPSNDLFAGRTRLEGLFASVAGSSRRSTFERDSSEPQLVVTNTAGEPGPPPALNTVWYGWRAPEDGRTRVVVTNVTFDTRVAVYRGDALGNLEWVAAGEGRDGADETSLAVFEARAGVDYAIQVDGGNYGGRSGDFRFVLVLDHPPRIVAGSVRRTSDAALEFLAETVPGRVLRVEASTDLRNWTVVAESTPAEARSTIRVPETAAGFRFYRLDAPEGP